MSRRAGWLVGWIAIVVGGCAGGVRSPDAIVGAWFGAVLGVLWLAEGLSGRSGLGRGLVRDAAVVGGVGLTLVGCALATAALEGASVGVLLAVPVGFAVAGAFAGAIAAYAVRADVYWAAVALGSAFVHVPRSLGDLATVGLVGCAAPPLGVAVGAVLLQTGGGPRGPTQVLGGAVVGAAIGLARVGQAYAAEPPGTIDVGPRALAFVVVCVFPFVVPLLSERLLADDGAPPRPAPAPPDPPPPAWSSSAPPPAPAPAEDPA